MPLYKEASRPASRVAGVSGSIHSEFPSFLKHFFKKKKSSPHPREATRKGHLCPGTCRDETCCALDYGTTPFGSIAWETPTGLAFPAWAPPTQLQVALLSRHCPKLGKSHSGPEGQAKVRMAWDSRLTVTHTARIGGSGSRECAQGEGANCQGLQMTAWGPSPAQRSAGSV